MEYGLIGSKLGHSYSKVIHEMLCDYTYDLHPLPTEAGARAFLAAHEFKAINVTIPYKKLVMEYCAQIDPRAAAIGAVNTVVNRGGKLYGYNTDYLGFAHLAAAHGVDFAGRTVLVLGTGGTHNTVSAVARDAGAAQVLTVSRTPDKAKGELSYDEAIASGAQIVVNTTPAGMYPNVGVCPLDLAALHAHAPVEAVLDVVYNPYRTELVLRAEEAGIPVAVGGLEMLVAQAVYAAEYFLDQKFPDAIAEIDRITAALRADILNIAVIGMPSSGKSTLGAMLAQATGKTFVDLDAEIEREAGCTIPEIFAAEGEAGFRARESAVTARFAKENRLLLSCGGGIVTRPVNIRALRQNGVVLFLDRPLDQLAVGGDRPLSSSMDALRAMERTRRPLYEAAADAVIRNDTTLDAALAAAQEALYEVYRH
jgi:shikimate dehydrogenase